jgi:hypothetical protein
MLDNTKEILTCALAQRLLLLAQQMQPTMTKIPTQNKIGNTGRI